MLVSQFYYVDLSRAINAIARFAETSKKANTYTTAAIILSVFAQKNGLGKKFY